LEAALRETEAVAARMDSGGLHPTSPFGLTYAIVSSIARREAEMVAEIAREVGLLEQRVMADADEDPQEFLSQLFAARHELLTIKTMAEQRIYRRAIKLTRFAPTEGLELMKDVLDQYESVAHISDSQLRFLIGVTEFYRARTDTKMAIAAERLARHRSCHAPYYVAVFGGRDERDRQRIHLLGVASHPAIDHVDHVGNPAALGSQARLVVIIRAAQPVAGRMGVPPGARDWTGPGPSHGASHDAIVTALVPCPRPALESHLRPGQGESVRTCPLSVPPRLLSRPALLRLDRSDHSS
jgi:CorA-like Mg2+ transporter protein